MLELPREARVEKVLDFLCIRRTQIARASSTSNTMITQVVKAHPHFHSYKVEQTIYNEIILSLKTAAPGYKPTFKQLFDKEPRQKAA